LAQRQSTYKDADNRRLTSRPNRIEHIGFISDANRERGIKAGPIIGIGDKTRWTKPTGEAATVSYGDCKERMGVGSHRSGMRCREIQVCLS